MLNTRKGQPPPLFIEEGPKLAVTLKFCENRAFADCPPRRNRTVRNSNPMARTAMVACHSRPLEPRGDRPPPRGGQSAVQNPEHQETKIFLTKTGCDLRTVPSSEADRTPYNLRHHPKSRMVLFVFKPESGGPSAPSSGRFTGLFPAKPIIGKMVITFNSVNQIR